VVPAGIPRAASLLLLPAALLAALWSICIVLAIGDLPAAFGGNRPFGPALSSLALCVARAAGGWSSVGAVLGRQGRAYAAAAALTLGLDATLACVAIPCSDTRANDVTTALTGLLVHAPLTLGFAWSLWRRRGVVAAAADGANPAEVARRMN
jgi:hypothetical protein